MEKKMTRKLMALGFVAGIFVLFGCGKKASEEDCKKLGDKLIEIQTEGLSAAVKSAGASGFDKAKADFVKECTGKRMPSDGVTCADKAKDQAAFMKCLGG